jgi:hypothetical protein
MFMFLVQDFDVRMSNNYMEQLVFENGKEIMKMKNWNMAISEMMDNQAKVIVNWKRGRLCWERKKKRLEEEGRLKPLERNSRPEPRRYYRGKQSYLW